MNILIAGATGLIGQALVPSLLQSGHRVTVLSREKHKAQTLLKTTSIDWDDLSAEDPNRYDAVINLSGVNINEKRWNPAFKQTLINSRVDSTKKLVAWANDSNKKIRFLNASAARSAYWGRGYQAIFDESIVSQGEPQLFTQQLVQQWEGELSHANDNLSVAIMRFAVVLSAMAGALKEIIDKSQLKTYAIIGNGKQPFAWVDIDDAVAAIVFLLTHPELTGPFNVVAPDSVSQAEFAKAFANAAHKYIPIKMPAFVVKLLFGEMADELLLTGINVRPKKLLAAGFAFHYEKLADSLHHLLK